MYIKSKLSLIGLTVLFFLVLFPQNRLTASNHCGDVSFDGICDIEDLVLFVRFAFFEDVPEEIDLVDIDLVRDGVFDIADLVFMVDYQFRNGPAPVCGLDITENPSACLNFYKASKNENIAKSSQSECLPFEVDSTSYKIEWYGEAISIEHFGLNAQCCLKFALFHNITFTPDYVIVDVYEKDTAEFPCDCLCDFNVSGLVPIPMFYEPTDYLVNLYDFDYQLLTSEVVPVGGPGSLETEVNGNALTIWHHNALYNCCPAFYSEYQLVDRNITFTWHDSLGLCDCICRYDLEATIDYLADGEYYVTLLNDGYPTGGDTIGVDTVLIGSAGPYISDGSHSGCLAPAKSAEEDYYVFGYDNNTLTYNHYNVTYNCAFNLDFSLRVDGKILRFYETNRAPDPALCLCQYNITQTISNIEPGDYLLEVYTQDVFDPEPELVYSHWHSF